MVCYLSEYLRPIDMRTDRPDCRRLEASNTGRRLRNTQDTVFDGWPSTTGTEKEI